MFTPLVVLLEIDTAGFAILEFEGNAPRSIDVDRIARRIESVQRVKVEAGTFISSARKATSRRSSLAKMRLCIFASIFELLPFVHNSERALLLKGRITAKT